MKRTHDYTAVTVTKMHTKVHYDPIWHLRVEKRKLIRRATTSAVLYNIYIHILLEIQVGFIYTFWFTLWSTSSKPKSALWSNLTSACRKKETNKTCHATTSAVLYNIHTYSFRDTGGFHLHTPFGLPFVLPVLNQNECSSWGGLFTNYIYKRRGVGSQKIFDFSSTLIW